MKVRTKSRMFYGYIIVTACFFLMMVFWGTYNSFSVFFKPLLEMGWSRSALSAAFSIMSCLLGVFSLPIAKLCEKYGVRKVVFGAGVCMGAGNLLLSQVQSIWMFHIIYDILIAIGMGAYFSLLPLISRWFIRRRGLMTGILFSGMGLSAIIFPPMFSRLIDAFGWRSSFLILGAIVLAVAGTASQFLRDYPEDMGLMPYGGSAQINQDKYFAGNSLNLPQAMRTFQYWLFTGLYFAYSFYLTIIIAHIVAHSMDIGITAGAAASVMSVFGLFQILGMNSMGVISDRYGHKAAFILSLMLTVLAFILLLTVAKTTPTMYIFSLIMGFAAGGMLTLFAPTVGDVFGLKSQGVIIGAISFAGGIGALMGPFIAGVIFDARGSYFFAFLLCTTMAAMAAGAAFLIRPLDLSGKKL